MFKEIIRPVFYLAEDMIQKRKSELFIAENIKLIIDKIKTVTVVFEFITACAGSGTYLRMRMRECGSLGPLVKFLFLLMRRHASFVETSHSGPAASRLAPPNGSSASQSTRQSTAFGVGTPSYRQGVSAPGVGTPVSIVPTAPTQHRRADARTPLESLASYAARPFRTTSAFSSQTRAGSSYNKALPPLPIPGAAARRWLESKRGLGFALLPRETRPSIVGVLTAGTKFFHLLFKDYAKDDDVVEIINATFGGRGGAKSDEDWRTKAIRGKQEEIKIILAFCEEMEEVIPMLELSI